MTARPDPRSDENAPRHAHPQPSTARGGAVPYAQAPGLSAQNDREKTDGMLCHALAFVGVAIPLGGIFGPLVWWLMKKDTSPYVDRQGRNALNFQITAAAVIALCALSIFVCVGVVLTSVAVLTWLVFTIVGTVEAGKGKGYRYPVAVPLL